MLPNFSGYQLFQRSYLEQVHILYGYKLVFEVYKNTDLVELLWKIFRQVKGWKKEMYFLKHHAYAPLSHSVDWYNENPISNTSERFKVASITDKKQKMLAIFSPKNFQLKQLYLFFIWITLRNFIVQSFALPQAHTQNTLLRCYSII